MLVYAIHIQSISKNRNQDERMKNHVKVSDLFSFCQLVLQEEKIKVKSTWILIFLCHFVYIFFFSFYLKKTYFFFLLLSFLPKSYKLSHFLLFFFLPISLILLLFLSQTYSCWLCYSCQTYITLSSLETNSKVLRCKENKYFYKLICDNNSYIMIIYIILI